MRILHLAERPADAGLWQSALGAESEVTWVVDANALGAELERGGYDAVVAEFSAMPAGSANALRLAHRARADLPFVFLVEDHEEDQAIEALNQGVGDYVLKSHPKRLGSTLTHALRQRREQRELGAAMKELEAFSYSVSHDLRAPLRGIDGFARALIEECGPGLGPEGLRLVGTIRSETRRMAQLIDDLLAFSRAGRQQIEPSGIDMTELARSAFQNMVEAMPGAPPTFDLQPLPAADGDRSMLRQVFTNLLGNAIKFSARHPTPRIEVSGWPEGPNNVYVVRDNGVGFDPRYAHKLFSVFQRLHRQEDFEGTGVGLALVQRIVQRHGGRVWAESKPNEGALFYFALPSRNPTAPC
jgi:light-regulated signal transduction histidine kinase (bacteriophytochrome)